LKVLITGATGFVGSHVVDVLLERGHDVFYIARSTSNMRWLDGKKVTRVDGSLFDVDSLKDAVTGMDALIHVAGLTAARNEAEFRKGNLDATQNLIDAVRAYNPGLKSFVHTSSLTVCGPAPSLERPTTEDQTDLRPLTAYGRTKKLAEDAVRQAMDIPWTIVRPPAVYGPRDAAILSFFQAVHKGLATLIGFGDSRVSLVHARDLARGIVMAMEQPVAIHQTYFITSDEFYSWPQIVDVTKTAMGKSFVLPVRLPHSLVLGIAGTVGFFGKLSGKPPVLDYEKGLDLIQPYWICSSEKASRDLGYRQEVSLKDGIRGTVQWYREHKWL
jgi:nucleoside-diphosphate-sugar epimerase